MSKNIKTALELLERHEKDLQRILYQQVAEDQADDYIEKMHALALIIAPALSDLQGPMAEQRSERIKLLEKTPNGAVMKWAERAVRVMEGVLRDGKTETWEHLLTVTPRELKKAIEASAPDITGLVEAGDELVHLLNSQAVLWRDNAEVRACINAWGAAKSSSPKACTKQEVEDAEPFKPSPIEVGSDRWKVEGPGGYRLRGLNEVNARFQADRMNHAYSLGRQSLSTGNELTYTKPEGPTTLMFFRNEQGEAHPLIAYDGGRWSGLLFDEIDRRLALSSAQHGLNTTTHV